MNLRVIAVVGFVCVAASASAADTAPPPVETMTCEQMTVELVAAGQKMNSQMDPEFAKEAQAMANEASGAGSAGSMIGGIGSAVACSLPGIGMLCMIGQQTQAMAQGDQTEQNIERMQAQMERMQKAMEGLDMDRLTVLSQRFEEQKCPVPQQ